MTSFRDERAAQDTGRLQPLQAGAPAAPAPAGRDDLYAFIEKHLARTALDDEAQYELARLLSAVESAKPDLLPHILPEAKVAVRALLDKEPKLQLARTIRYRLDMELMRNNGTVTRQLVTFTNGNPVAIVGLGLLLTLVLGWSYHILASQLQLPLFDQLMMVNDRMIGLVAEAAFWGGAVSILSRFRDFSRLRDFDPVFLFFNGLLKPYVGIIFAVFAYAFVMSGLLPFEWNAEKQTDAFVWWVAGFLSGFSERFTKDIISRGEGAFATAKS